MIIAENFIGIDFANSDYKKIIPQDTSALLELYDNQVTKVFDSLAGCTDEQMQEGWTFRNGGAGLFHIAERAGYQEYMHKSSDPSQGAAKYIFPFIRCSSASKLRSYGRRKIT